METAPLSSPPKVQYEESNLSFLLASPLYFDCGIQIICVRGEGILSTGAQQFHLHETTELIFWRGSIMQLIEASADFRVRMLCSTPPGSSFRLRSHSTPLISTI